MSRRIPTPRYGGIRHQGEAKTIPCRDAGSAVGDYDSLRDEPRFWRLMARLK
jgi:hypothetical protein